MLLPKPVQETPVVDAAHRSCLLARGVDAGTGPSLCLTCLGEWVSLHRRFQAMGGHLTSFDIPAGIDGILTEVTEAAAIA
ncbi:MAG: hypothetical protein L0Z62_10485 [Gemmataceae bacterium]|nr:hypothetical protein [Gemmataceae bacterium]